MSINLGDRVRDSINGFQGIATGKVYYMTGCNQILVSPESLTDGKFPEGEWIDDVRLDIVQRNVIRFDGEPILREGLRGALQRHRELLGREPAELGRKEIGAHVPAAGATPAAGGPQRRDPPKR